MVGEREHPARHAEMAEQDDFGTGIFGAQFKEEVFAAPGEAVKFRPAQTLFERREGSWVQNLWPADLNPADRPPAEQRTQVTDEDFDFRQFGHG